MCISPWSYTILFQSKKTGTRYLLTLIEIYTSISEEQAENIFRFIFSNKDHITLKSGYAGFTLRKTTYWQEALPRERYLSLKNCRAERRVVVVGAPGAGRDKASGKQQGHLLEFHYLHQN